MFRVLALLVTLSGCDSCKEVGAGAGWDLSFLPFIDGNVYECTITEPNATLCPDALDGLCTREWCYDDGAEALTREIFEAGWGYAIHCYATPRHLGPCRMVCDGGGGCNALNGCWCGGE